MNDFETLCSKQSCRRFTNPKSATYSSSSVDGTALKYTPSLLDFCTGQPPTVQVSRSPSRRGLKPLGKWPHVLKQFSRGRKSSTCTIQITVDTADSGNPPWVPVVGDVMPFIVGFIGSGTPTVLFRSPRQLGFFMRLPPNHCTTIHFNTSLFNLRHSKNMGQRTVRRQPFQTSYTDEFICKIPSHEPLCWREPSQRTLLEFSASVGHCSKRFGVKVFSFFVAQTCQHFLEKM